MYVDFNSLPDTREPRINPLTRDQIIASLAYHEAGHTITGMHYGMSVARTRVHTIDVDGRTGWTGTTTWNHSFVLYFDLAVELAAGGVAGTRYLRDNNLLTASTAECGAAPHDRDMAFATFAKTGFPFTLNGTALQGGATWEQATAAATDMTDRLWGRITAVAEGLIADPRHELSGDQVVELIGLTAPAPTA
ncbi:hypothetical protein ACFYNF_33930 [Streptomyces sp. NPDC006641]|uniref:hypothetical protein n=1 Tax=unclassified Streptomyces TaxID=2593676 RepID=UPI0036857B55